MADPRQLSDSRVLETIVISDFRSIRGTIALPLDAPVVLLHGTNGAGKTTVMSALELALTGDIAELSAQDRRHLIHREGQTAAIALTSSSASAAIRIERGSISGEPLLSREDSRFFTERCYLAQRTLGQLLEIYQAIEGDRDSALTRFVKEMLGLDELDALLEGLDAVRDKRLVKKLVPEYADAELLRESTRQAVRLAEQRVQTTSSELESLRVQLDESLRNLGAPREITGRYEADGPAARWLATVDDDDRRSMLIASRQELAALRLRLADVNATDAGRDAVAAEASATRAQRAADGWRQSDGARLEALLEELRGEFPGLPSALGSSDPIVVHHSALEQVTATAEQVAAELRQDDEALVEQNRLQQEIATGRARIAALDEQLGSSETASIAEDLGRVLAALIPHVHDDDCPVCGRDFSEVSGEPLAARLAIRVSELNERAERLQMVVKARIAAADALRAAEALHEALIARILPPAEKAASNARVTRLAEAKRRLEQLSPGINEGARVIRLAVEAERAHAVLLRRHRALSEIQEAMSRLIVTVNLPLGDQGPLGDELQRIETHIESQLEALERRDRSRQSAGTALAALTEKLEEQRAVGTELNKLHEEMEGLLRAIEELEGRRHQMRTVKAAVEASRTRIIRRVFSESLNQKWRELFVRLAPDEPFVPAFVVPSAASKRVAARLQTVHRDGKPGGSPGAMLSAGNLNTAALTLFLALNLSTPPRVPWLFLDDPVQSMDEVHVSQFAALLRTLAKQQGRRIVIAVHERSLFEYLALELSPAQPGDSLITVELSRSPMGDSVAKPELLNYRAETALVAV